MLYFKFDVIDNRIPFCQINGQSKLVFFVFMRVFDSSFNRDRLGISVFFVYQARRQIIDAITVKLLVVEHNRLDGIPSHYGLLQASARMYKRIL